MRAKVTDLVDGTWAGDINVHLELIGILNKDKSEMIGRFQAVGSDRARAGEFRMKRNKS